ncbi:MAG: hypothetical protein P8L78_14470 [Mariniblastus sp.]|nr:hypothetical protein [Mariniblastus sp.]MDG2182890.1 hypothetical protein [Mariniblastus sp.]
MENQQNQLMEKTRQVMQHLRQESVLLDAVIESSLEVQSILKEQRKRQTDELVSSNSETEAGQKLEVARSHYGRNEEVRARLNRLNSEITEKFHPVLEARKRLPLLLSELEMQVDTPVSVTNLSRKISEPMKSELMTLRNEVKTKYNEFSAIAMGNQTVLVYTLSYFDQVLAGGRSGLNSYDASGQTQKGSPDSGFLKTSC